MTPAGIRLPRAIRGWPVLLGLLHAACGGEGGPSIPPHTEEDGDPFVFTGAFAQGEASVPWHLSISPDGRWAVILDSAQVRFHDFPSHREVSSEEPGDMAASRPAVFTRDSRRCIFVVDDALVVREIAQGAWVTSRSIPLGFRPGIHYPMPERISLTPGEKSAMFVDKGKAWKVDLESGRTERFASEVPNAWSAMHLEDGTVVVTTLDETGFHTIDVGPDGIPIRRTEGGLIESSADGALRLVAARRTGNGAVGDGFRWADWDLRVLESATGSVRANFGVVELTQAAFSPDGRWLAIGDDLKSIVIRDARTGAVRQRIHEYEGDRIIHLAFSPDSRTLITAGRPGDGSQRGILEWHRRP